jgi:hypothetical protein
MCTCKTTPQTPNPKPYILSPFLSLHVLVYSCWDKHSLSLSLSLSLTHSLTHCLCTSWCAVAGTSTDRKAQHGGSRWITPPRCPTRSSACKAWEEQCFSGAWCVCVCVCVCELISVYRYMYTHTHTHTHTHPHTQTHIYTHRPIPATAMPRLL